jgi:hypothetical protein
LKMSTRPKKKYVKENFFCFEGGLHNNKSKL